MGDSGSLARGSYRRHGELYFAHSINAERVRVRGIVNANDGEPYLALAVVGPRDGHRSPEVYLNMGHVEQLQRGLLLALRDANVGRSEA